MRTPKKNLLSVAAIGGALYYFGMTEFLGSLYFREPDSSLSHNLPLIFASVAVFTAGLFCLFANYAVRKYAPDTRFPTVVNALFIFGYVVMFIGTIVIFFLMMYAAMVYCDSFGEFVSRLFCTRLIIVLFGEILAAYLLHFFTAERNRIYANAALKGMNLTVTGK